MTPVELRKIGEACYGERWQTPLANAIGIGTRSIRYMLSGKRPITGNVARDIAALMMTRQAELRKVARGLE